MRLAIGKVLDPGQLAELRRLLAGGEWQDGRRTAGSAARQVKHNLQLASAGEAYARAVQIVAAALEANETFQAAALPRVMGAAMFARYENGMGYGSHVDNAVMRGPELRTDLAYTLFLAEPTDYVGGDLVLEEAEGENHVRLAAGDLFLYPATTLHRVDTVTEGRRDVCVGWVQSLVRDPHIRELIFDLTRVRRLLEGDPTRTAEDRLIAKSVSNLLRMHADV